MLHKSAISMWQNRRIRERAKGALARLSDVYTDNPDMELIGKEVPPDHPYRIRVRAMTEFFHSAEQILSALKKGVEPPREALANLTEALNQPVRQIECRKSSALGPTLDSEIKDGYYFLRRGRWTFQMDKLRYAAEAVREYLETTAICGLIHTACKLEGCTNIVFGGRGNKQFCCDEHRKEFWSYAHQRNYFQSSQRITRQKRKEQNEKKRLREMERKLKELEAQRSKDNTPRKK